MLTILFIQFMSNIFAEMVNCLVVKLVDMVHMVESLGFKPSGTSTGGFTPWHLKSNRDFDGCVGDDIVNKV